MYYKLKNLCVAFVVPIYQKEDNLISTIPEKGFYIIAKQETNGSYNYCIDMFTGNKYMCFSSVRPILLKYNLEKYFVSATYPINKYIDETGLNKINKKELKTLYKNLNGIGEKNEELEEESNKIDDPLLTMLLKTKDKIVKSNLSEKEKNEMKERLINLATEYMTLLLKYDKNTGFTRYKYDLWKKYTEKIAQIELEIFNQKNKLNSNHLEEQLKTLKKMLNS